MARSEAKKPRRVVALDGSRLGNITGSCLACGTLAWCFFYREMDLASTMIRSGWAFVMGYGATFFLARAILRVTLYQALEEKKARREEILARRRRAREEATAAATGGVYPASMLGTTDMMETMDAESAGDMGTEAAGAMEAEAGGAPVEAPLEAQE